MHDLPRVATASPAAAASRGSQPLNETPSKLAILISSMSRRESGAANDCNEGKRVRCDMAVISYLLSTNSGLLIKPQSISE